MASNTKHAKLTRLPVILSVLDKILLLYNLRLLMSWVLISCDQGRGGHHKGQGYVGYARDHYQKSFFIELLVEDRLQTILSRKLYSYFVHVCCM